MAKYVIGGMFLGASLVGIMWWTVASRTPGIPIANSATETLSADWSLVEELPAIPNSDGGTLIPAERLKLTVEQGWLVARFEAGNDLQWSIVLARITGSNPPIVHVDPQLRSINVRYESYFIRENSGRLRVNRQKKAADVDDWPTQSLETAKLPQGNAWNLHMSQVGDCC